MNTLEDAQEKRRYVTESLNKFIETSIKIKKSNGTEQDGTKKSVDDSYKNRVKLFGKNFATTSKKLKSMEQKFQNLFELQGATTETSGMMVAIKNLKEQQENLKTIYKFLKDIYQDNKASISQIDENIKNAEALEQKLLNAGMIGAEFKNVTYGHSDVIDDFGIIVKINSIDKAIGILVKDISRYVSLGDQSIKGAYKIAKEVNAFINEKSSILDGLLLSLGIENKGEKESDEQKHFKKTDESTVTKVVDIVESDPRIKNLISFVNELNLQKMKDSNGQSYLQTSWLNFATNPQNGVGQPLLVALTLKFNQKFESKEQLMEVIRSAMEVPKQQISL